MSENINVRPGNQADLPQVLELIKELAEFTGYLDQVKTTVEQMLIDGFGEKPVFEFLVATRGEDIIGTSIYYYRYSTWKGRRLYLEDLVVRESERSKGIGKLLFNATMKQALADNCTGMMWQVLHWNEKAIAFYEKYGSHFDKEFVNCNLEADQMKSFIS